MATLKQLERTAEGRKLVSKAIELGTAILTPGTYRNLRTSCIGTPIIGYRAWPTYYELDVSFHGPARFLLSGPAIQDCAEAQEDGDTIHLSDKKDDEEDNSDESSSDDETEAGSIFTIPGRQRDIEREPFEGSVYFATPKDAMEWLISGLEKRYLIQEIRGTITTLTRIHQKLGYATTIWPSKPYSNLHVTICHNPRQQTYHAVLGHGTHAADISYDSSHRKEKGKAKVMNAGELLLPSRKSDVVTSSSMNDSLKWLLGELKGRLAIAIAIANRPSARGDRSEK